jgi:hypothetical protein
MVPIGGKVRRDVGLRPPAFEIPRTVERDRARRPHRRRQHGSLLRVKNRHNTVTAAVSCSRSS